MQTARTNQNISCFNVTTSKRNISVEFMAGTWSHISYNFCLAKRLKKTIWSTISTNQKVAIIIEPVCHSSFLVKHFRYLLPTTITDNTLWPRLAKLSIYVVRSILAMNEWSGNLTGTWPAVYFSTCVDSFSLFLASDHLSYLPFLFGHSLSSL